MMDAGVAGCYTSAQAYRRDLPDDINKVFYHSIV
jgi:hypothetical protein